MNKMQELYELTKRFNTISGAIHETSITSFIEQYNYIAEEFGELSETMMDDGALNCANALDDCIDIVITVFGMIQKLETLGADVNGAAIATAMNNLSKYPAAPAVAHETVERKARDGVEVLAKFNEDFGVYTLRNVDNGKVVKPYNFVSNDLSAFVPKNLEVK
jgi:hypothetical protein